MLRTLPRLFESSGRAASDRRAIPVRFHVDDLCEARACELVFPQENAGGIHQDIETRQIGQDSCDRRIVPDVKLIQ